MNKSSTQRGFIKKDHTIANAKKMHNYLNEEIKNLSKKPHNISIPLDKATIIKNLMKKLASFEFLIEHDKDIYEERI